MESLIERFLRYVRIDTQSDETSESFPSTDKQLTFLRMLRDELTAMGLKEVSMDGHGYVMATIPATTAKELPVVGFISHVDTSPDFSGTNVQPRIITYEGGDIVLNEREGIVTHLADFPELAGYKGQRLIVTDGTTLLGADDKAGVAEIMTAAAYLMAHPEIEHGAIRVGFTPDEEIGRGVDFFDVPHFGANFAYTMDGGALGEIEYENFNAASATIEIQGRSVHPGYAKGKMINALRVAEAIDYRLPAHERPEYTEGYEGFLHLTKLSGGVDRATMQYIIRDHNRTSFEERKAVLQKAVDAVNEVYGAGTARLTLTDSYYNMREVLEKHMEVVQYALEAMKALGITPKISPIRGGTDGARLSFMSLPCPNLFAGGVNYHGRHEFAAVETMEKAAALIVEIVRQIAK